MITMCDSNLFPFFCTYLQLKISWNSTYIKFFEIHFCTLIFLENLFYNFKITNVVLFVDRPSDDHELMECLLHHLHYSTTVIGMIDPELPYFHVPQTSLDINQVILPEIESKLLFNIHQNWWKKILRLKIFIN